MTFGEFLKYLLLLIFFPRSLKTMEWRMLRLLNKDRKKHNLPALRMQEDLRSVARKHSKDMAKKDYFQHVNLEGKSPSDRLKIARITDVISGENLAKIGGYRNPTQFAEEGLMNSPGHRANILQPLYNVVGIGVIQDLRKIYYFTQNFAKREVIFQKKFPEKVRLKRNLVLTGEVFGSVESILFQVHLPGQHKELFQRVSAVHNGKFSFQIAFPYTGLFELWVFAQLSNKNSYGLCNKFEIRVINGFWG